MSMNSLRLLRINLNYRSKTYSILSRIKSLSIRYLEIILPVTSFIALTIVYLLDLGVYKALNERVDTAQIEINRARESSSSRGHESVLDGDKADAKRPGGISGGRDVFLSLLSEISGSIPDFAWLTELSVRGGKISLKGRAMDSLTVANFIQARGGSNLISQLEIKAVKQFEKNGIYLQEFSAEAYLR